MTPYNKEQLENIRRVCESAKSYGNESHTWQEYVSMATDTFQHVIDLVEVIKENNK